MDKLKERYKQFNGREIAAFTFILIALSLTVGPYHDSQTGFTAYFENKLHIARVAWAGVLVAAAVFLVWKRPKGLPFILAISPLVVDIFTLCAYTLDIQTALFLLAHIAGLLAYVIWTVLKHP